MSGSAAGKVKAGELLAHVASRINGKGGGRPDLAQGGGAEKLMIDATHLKAHRTAASLLKKGLYPDVSDAAGAD